MDKVLAQLRYNDLEIKNIETYKMIFENENLVDYSKNSRRKNLLHLVTGGKRFYEIEGRSFLFRKVRLYLYLIIQSIKQLQLLVMVKNAVAKAFLLI